MKISAWKLRSSVRKFRILQMERPVDQKLGVEHSLACQRPLKGLKMDEIWIGTHEVPPGSGPTVCFFLPLDLNVKSELNGRLWESDSAPVSDSNFYLTALGDSISKITQ